MSIVEDGCDGTVERYSDDVTIDGPGETPAVLEPGTYGLRATARDDACTVFASGCAEVTLPSPMDEVVVEVRAITEEPCAGTCAMGACTEAPDAGTMIDASVTDAGTSDGGSDAGSRTVVPSNVDPSVIGFDASSSALMFPDVAAIVTVNTDDGSITAGGFTVRPAGEGVHRGTGVAFALVPSASAGARPLGVFVVGSLEVPSTLRIEAVGSSPFVLLSQGPVRIDGLIDVSSSAARAGAGGGTGGAGVPAAAAGVRGGGSGGGEGGLPGAGDYDAGGGGGGFGSGGGHGGGTLGASTGGSGGVVYGDATLIPLVGGSGGGAGAGPSRDGGHGGGAVQITSATSITIGPTGRIDAGGGGGRGGPREGSTTSGGGSGGGSGGAILLEAPTVAIEGSVGANGGGGGRGGNVDSPPADGADGDTVTVPAPGAPMMAPRGGGGGDGSAADGAAENGETSEEGGGGGGGAGRIRINTASATETYDRVTPTQASGLTTVGTITVR